MNEISEIFYLTFFFFFAQRLLEEKRRDIVLGFPSFVMSGAWLRI